MRKVIFSLFLLIALLAVVISAVGYFGLIGLGDSEKPVACTMEAKLCSDGSYVGRVPPNCEFAPCPKEDLIQIESPRAYETTSSPLIIKGKARGYWFFEATFPIKLLDKNGNVLVQTYAQTQGEWMTKDFVPFETEVDFAVSETQQGTLVLEKSNPSDLPENYDEIRIPVTLQETGRTVKLYYYNPELDRDESGNTACSREGLVAVERKIPITKTPIQDTIKLLLLGKLTREERARGITTEYPLEGLLLKGALLKDGVLTLEFDDPNNETVGGSCRVGVLWFQIEATAKQFPEVKKVQFLPEELFQP